MGKRGPKPKLAQLSRIEGNPSKRPIVEPSVVAAGAPFIPDHLHDDAQACVEVICASMPKQVYAKLDGFVLADYGTWWAWHKAATHEMNSPTFEPVVVGSKGQEQPNPWFKILALASQRMQALGDRLGLDPKARATLHVPEQDKPQSKFAGLIGQKRSSTSLNN